MNSSPSVSIAAPYTSRTRSLVPFSSSNRAHLIQFLASGCTILDIRTPSRLIRLPAHPPLENRPRPCDIPQHLLHIDGSLKDAPRASVLLLLEFPLGVAEPVAHIETVAADIVLERCVGACTPGSWRSTASRRSCSALICCGAAALFLTRGGPREASIVAEKRQEAPCVRAVIQKLAELRESLTRAARFADQSNCGAEDSLMAVFTCKQTQNPRSRI
ncbi:hypothetical protein KC357_g96 [Hortaea werneckii]|nr:hypothetical protein KC357_g96 [Hortaea werneckii]